MSKRVGIVTVWYKSNGVLEILLEGWRLSIANSQPHVSLHVGANSDHGELANRVNSWGFGLDGSVSVRNFETNLGFAEACNQIAREIEVQWLLFLNPDVSLAPDTMDKLLHHTNEMESCGASVGAISLITGGLENCGIEWDRVGLFRDCSINRSERLVGPSAGAMLIKRSLFLSLGGFNKNLFMWGEDALLALELQRRGESTHIIPLGLRHIGGHSLGDMKERQIKAFMMARNRLLILRATFSLAYKLRYFPPVLTAMLLNLLIRKRAEKTGGAYLRGILSGLTCNIADFFPESGFTTPKTKLIDRIKRTSNVGHSSKEEI